MRDRHTARTDLAELKRRLGENVQALCLELFGQPTKRTAREWRWGRKGSVAVRFSGKAGPSFVSFEAGAGGSMLDAIAFAIGCSFPDAVEWARRWLGDDARPRPVAPPRQATRTYDVERDEAERIAAAAALWRAGRSLDGTAAQKYLVSRGIDRWPADVVRYIGAGDVARDRALRDWRWPAVMFVATDASGETRAVQIVALMDDGTPARDGDGRKIKRSRGCLQGAAVRLPGAGDAPLQIAEGPETALSAWLATGHETWATLGSVAHAPLADVDTARKVIVCRDDDPEDAPARRTVKRAAAAWRKEGRAIVAATPWVLSRNDKSDFNDVLMTAGLEAVRARIEAALREDKPARHTLTLSDARAQLTAGIAGSVDELLRHQEGDEPPPVLVHRVGLGLGKTETALREVAVQVHAGRRAAFLVPTHRLSAEILARAQRIAGDLPIGVWRGRAAANPARPGETMCMRPDLVDAARAGGANPKDTVCAVCPLRESCPYLQQDGQCADLWIAATDLVFQERPRAIGALDLLVIDESFVLNGLEGIDGPPLLVTRQMIEDMPAHGSGRDGATADLIAALMPGRRKLEAALKASTDGYLAQQAVLDAKLTSEECRRLANEEAKRFVKLAKTAEDSEGEMVRALKETTVNREVRLMVSMWRALGDLLDDAGPPRSGRLLRTTIDLDGAPVPALRLFGAKRFGEGWEVPTLQIDATADMSLIRERVGRRARLVQEIDAHAPHMDVLQYVGRFGKSALVGRRLERVWLWIVACARYWQGDWLVVCNKEVEDRIRAQGELPDFIRLAHFNGLRGVDDYRSVRGVVVLGRPMPAPQAVERMRGAVSGWAPKVSLSRSAETSGYYPRATATITPLTGAPRTVDFEAHPDALCESIRSAICDAEILQAIGRGRGVGRTAADPLQVLVLGGAPLKGLTPDEILDWEPPSADVEAFARTGIWSESARDSAILSGVSVRAIESARERKLPAFSKENLLLGNAGNLSVGSYARNRRGPRAGSGERVVYDPRTVADLSGTLKGKLGPLRGLPHQAAPGGVVECAVTGTWDFSFAPTD